MNFTNKATKLAALSLLLAPMALSTFNSYTTVMAEDVSTQTTTSQAKLHIHKRQFKHPDKIPTYKQNIGVEMEDFGGEALGGVKFKIIDISAFIVELREDHKLTPQKIQEGTFRATEVGLNHVVRFQLGDINKTKSILTSAIDITKATDNDKGAVTIDVDRKSGDDDASYLIIENSHPANVVQISAPMLVMFPVYEYNPNGIGFTNNVLGDIYLYPKNLTAVGDVLVNKQVQGKEGPLSYNGATFVVKNGAGKYLGEMAETGSRTWELFADAETFTTIGKGQISIDNIPRSSLAKETFYLEEIATGEGSSISANNLEIPFELDGAVNLEGYDYVFAPGDIVNNDLVVDKTTPDNVSALTGMIEYEVSFNVPEDITFTTDIDGKDFKYTNFFLLDEHDKGLKLDEKSIEFYKGTTKIDIPAASYNFYTLEKNKTQIEGLYKQLLPAGASTDLPDTKDYFAIDFIKVAEALAEYEDQRLTVKYSMKLTDATADLAVVNKASVFTGHEKEFDDSEIYTGGKQFVKIDSDTKEKLGDAEFYFADVNKGTPSKTKVLYTNLAGDHVWFEMGALTLTADGLAPLNHGTNKLVTRSSKADGTFEIQGLDYGQDFEKDSKIYTLMEYATPSDQYILPATGFDFEVSHGSYKVAKPREIENRAKGSLPSTGGIGTIVFYLVGAAAMAGVFVVARRKKTA